VPIPQPSTAAIPDYTPKELRDFGARIRAHRNESAFPLPPAILRAIRSIDESDLRQYPSDRYEGLANIAAPKLGVDPAGMVFGNGSDDLIYAIANAYLGEGTNVVTAAPTFGMYRRAALLRGAEVREIPYTTRWRIDAGAFADACDATTRVVYLCSPNNPTCELLDPADLDRIARAAPDALVVVDEAYLRGGASFFSSVGRYANVAVIATLSKVPGLAGLRCGFGAAPLEVARTLRRVMQPHPLTIPALRAMEAYFTSVFDDAAYARAYASFVESSLDRMSDAFERLGARVTRGATNFAVFEFGDRAARIAQALEARKILVRVLDSPAFDGALRMNALDPVATGEVIDAVKAALEPSYA
jgi:histidinol-phosphate aminotransferase